MNGVAVVGAGQMGAGIAQVAAAAEFDVLLVDTQPGQLERAIAGIGRSAEKLAAKQGPAAEAVLDRIATAAEIPASLSAAIAIEAVVESEQVKVDVLRALDRALPEEALLATNTSSISITRLAAATTRPERFVGMHFMNPVPVLPLVEVITGFATSDATVEQVRELARRMGKTPVEARDFPGFISNRVLMPLINEAIFCLMEGVGSPENIDAVLTLGMRHPIGPLALADLIGLDTCLFVMEVIHEGLGDSKYRPCPLLRQYGDAGTLGRKTGRGFYVYGES